MDILIPIRPGLKEQEIYFKIFFLAKRIIVCYSKK
jgi:hypothetical protein